MPVPPMVAIVGRKKHGKTTLTVQVVAELVRRGHRVMTIKHGAHTFNLDPSTTDTYRHYHEGNAERVAMAAPDKFALVSRWSEELPPEEIASRYMSDADIVVCEGFTGSALPKVEIFRRAVGGAESTPRYRADAAGAERYLAMVTDTPAAAGALPWIDANATDVTARVADIVERRVMRSP